jgi:hypothetical protein
MPCLRSINKSTAKQRCTIDNDAQLSIAWVQGNTYLAVNHTLGKIEFSNHAKWDGTSAWLGVVQLALENNSVDALFLGKDLGSAGSGRASSDNGDLVLHEKSTVAVGNTWSHRGGPGEGRREGRSRGGN